MSEWKVVIGEKQYGPYSLEKLREIHNEGRVPGEAQIWHPSRGQWLPVAQVAELLPGTLKEIVLVQNDSTSSSAIRPTSANAVVHRPDSLGDFLAFRRMITPLVIQILFWVGAVLASIAGILYLFTALKANHLAGVFLGLVIMLFGPVVVRILCELLMVLFRMSETLNTICEELKRKDQPTD